MAFKKRLGLIDAARRQGNGDHRELRNSNRKPRKSGKLLCAGRTPRPPKIKENIAAAEFAQRSAHALRVDKLHFCRGAGLLCLEIAKRKGWCVDSAGKDQI